MKTITHRGRMLGVAVLALAALATTGAPAQAQTNLNPFDSNSDIRRGLREFDQRRLDHMTPATSLRAGRDYTKVFVHNRSNQTIWVAIRYLPVDHPGDSELAVYGGDPWRTEAWFKLAPGERSHLANTSNRYVYVFAEGDRGGRWSGGLYKPVFGGGRERSVGFAQMQFSGMPRDYTIDLNP